MKTAELKIFPSVDEMNRFAAGEFARLAREAIAARGKFTIALSGGSTPKKLYELLARDFKNEIEWRKIHFFWGDERNVSPDDEESNFGAANEALLSKIDLPRENIHRFATEKQDARIAAEEMEAEIRDFFRLKENEFPRFDLILLGIGADGHTASLFPGTEALEEREKIVVANYVPNLETFRMTFTFPAINNARRVIFLAAGADKAEILHEILKGDAEKLPAELIQPQTGELSFLLDEKAAEKLAR